MLKFFKYIFLKILRQSNLQALTKFRKNLWKSFTFHDCLLVYVSQLVVVIAIEKVVLIWSQFIDLKRSNMVYWQFIKSYLRNHSFVVCTINNMKETKRVLTNFKTVAGCSTCYTQGIMISYGNLWHVYVTEQDPKVLAKVKLLVPYLSRIFQ